MAAEQHVRTLLLGLGEDVNREGLIDTPKRVAKAFKDMLRGYSVPLTSALGTALFNEPIVSSGPGGLVLVRDIEFASVSDASLLPFHGRCHVAYVPSNGVVLGLSKLARLTKLAARRVQSQETLSARVLGALCGALAPTGAVVVVDALHLTYSAPAPARRVTVAAAGSIRSSGASDVDSSSSSGLLEEALAMLDVDVSGAYAEQLSEPVPHTLLRAQTPGLCSLMMKQQQAKEHQQQQQQEQQQSGQCDAPVAVVAPATPDLSERDDSSSAASGCCDGDGDADADGAEADVETDAAAAAAAVAAPTPAATRGGRACSCDGGDGHEGRRTADAMQAAVTALLGESGARDAHSPAMRAAARRYVMSLLASTAGYAAPLPEAACGCAGSRDLASRECPGRQQQQVQQWHEVHVPFVSQCEHHMLPFYGTVHIACLPGDSSCACGVGAAALSRDAAEAIVTAFTQRLQVQERITQQVADAVARATRAPGVLVAVRAAHMCMVARGVENHAGTTLTRAATGEFAARPELRAAFLRAVAVRHSASPAAAATVAAPCSCCS